MGMAWVVESESKPLGRDKQREMHARWTGRERHAWCFRRHVFVEEQSSGKR